MRTDGYFPEYNLSRLDYITLKTSSDLNNAGCYNDVISTGLLIKYPTPSSDEAKNASVLNDHKMSAPDDTLSWLRAAHLTSASKLLLSPRIVTKSRVACTLTKRLKGLTL